MKKIIFLFTVLCVLFSNLINAQKNNYISNFVDKVIIDCDGTITHSEESVSSTDTHYWRTIVTLEDYYDFNLFKVKLKNKISEYSDVEVESPWTYDNEREYAYTFIIVVNDLLMVTFKNNVVAFNYENKEPKVSKE